MLMHPEKQRAVLPQDAQTGLPREIYYQPLHIGGSLGFGGKGQLTTFWDELEAEAAADAAVGLPGGPANLRQHLNNFLFQATVVSQLIVPYNASRVYLMVQNNGVSVVRIAFGRAADLNSGFSLAGGGGFYEPILGTVQSVHGIAAAGVQNVTVIEGFKAA